MANSKVYDVIVLGSGIAGLTAALRAVQKKADTLFVRLPRLPKEKLIISLHPGVQPIFDTIGLESLLSDTRIYRPTGYWQKTGDKTVFVDYGASAGKTWRGYVLLEDNLYAAMQDQLSKSPADILTTQDINIIHEGGHVQGAVLNGELYTSRLLIDASGGRSRVARTLNLGTLAGSPPLIVQYSGCLWDAEQQEPVFERRADGWIWSGGMPGRSGMTCSLLMNGGVSKFAKGRGCDVSWKYVPDCAGPGYAIIGDAALRFDPGAGNGVLRAMMGAIAASQILDAPDRWRDYRRWIADWAREDGQRLADLYGQPPFKSPWARNHTWTPIRQKRQPLAAASK